MTTRNRHTLMRHARRRFGAAAIAGVAIIALHSPFALAAEEMLVVKLSAKDGKFEPLKLEVPAGKRFKIEISNDGKGPMEFESKDLKQEKVLAAGAKSSVVINALKPGTYVFFDEYHPECPKGQIVAK
jgi:plastocyanin